MPSRRLLGLMVPSAQRSQVALARQSALIEWRRVIEVAPHGGTPAARKGAPSLTEHDQMPQRRRRRVAHRSPNVKAAAGLQHLESRDQTGGPPQALGWAGFAGRWSVASAGVRNRAAG